MCKTRADGKAERTYNNAVIPNVYSTSNLGSFDNAPLAYVDEIRYSDWVERKCSISQHSLPPSLYASSSAFVYAFTDSVVEDVSGKEHDLPLIYLPWRPDDRSLAY